MRKGERFRETERESDHEKGRGEDPQIDEERVTDSGRDRERKRKRKGD